MKKRVFTVMIFVLFFNINAAASMVSFCVIETGLPENRAFSDHSVQWENAFMDVFFDAGYIVSNYPMTRLEEKPKNGIMESAGINIMDARIWGIDFIIISQLDYSDFGQPPNNITLLIYKVNTSEKIYERQFDGRTYRSAREEHDDIKGIIRSLVPYIAG